MQLMPIGTCPALRRDGKACGARAASGEVEFCSHHLGLIEIHGEERVRTGRIPRRRYPEEPVALIETPIPSGNVNRAANPSTISPSSIRSKLAEAAAEDVDAIREAIRTAALGATKEHWILVQCDDCGRKKRVQVHVPDVRARLDALQIWLNESLGKVQQSEEPQTTSLPRTAVEVEKLSWEEMQLVFAASFIEEIAAAEGGEGEALLRERVAKLSEGERRVLREALASAPPLPLSGQLCPGLDPGFVPVERSADESVSVSPLLGDGQ